VGLFANTNLGTTAALPMPLERREIATPVCGTRFWTVGTAFDQRLRDLGSCGDKDGVSEMRGVRLPTSHTDGQHNGGGGRGV